jgi:hypothetical protein
MSQADAIRVLNEEAMASPPGANGLVMLPYFSGALTPLFDPAAKGLISGLDLTHTRGDMFRAALEGIAQATRHIIETYAKAGVPPRESLRGGRRHEKQGVDASHIRQLQHGAAAAREIWGASFGDAFLAALAVGDVKPGDMAKWNPVTGEIRPDSEPCADSMMSSSRSSAGCTRRRSPGAEKAASGLHVLLLSSPERIPATHGATRVGVELAGGWVPGTSPGMTDGEASARKPTSPIRSSAPSRYSARGRCR